MHYVISSPLESLPSPIYGGDYYYQLGQTNHVKYGGSPLDSATINGALPGYFVLHSALSGGIARFGLSAIDATYFLSYLTIIASVGILFLLGKKFFGNNTLLVSILVLAFITPHKIPVLKYTDFAFLIMIPLFLLLLFNFLDNSSRKNGLFLGLVYGLIGLTHAVAFISASFLMLGVIFYYGIWKNFRGDGLNISSIKQILNNYIPVFAVGIPIAMLYWWTPIFVHFGQTSLNYTEWNNQDWGNFGFQIQFLWSTLKSYFLTFSSFQTALFSAFSLLGIVGLSMIKGRSKSGISKNSYLRFLVFSSLVITFHYLITENLFGVNFIPDYIAILLLTPVMLILFVFGVSFGYGFLRHNKVRRGAYLGFVVLLLLFSQVTAFQEKVDNQWYQVGLGQSLPPQLLDLNEYLVDNSEVDDVILTSKELGFAVNAFTGRKLLSVRRAQNDPFIEMDPRELAQSIILYGDDVGLKKALIKEYDIKYLYWDGYWVQSEYHFDDTGKLTGWFDPLIMFDSEDNRKVLESNGVKYFIQNTWVDPALKGDIYQTFDLIFVSPENYVSGYQPWHSNLNPLLEEVWSYKIEGQKSAVLYEVRVE